MARIDGLSRLEVIDAISARLSYIQPGAKYSFQFKMGSWDGRVRLLNKQLQFPSGLVDEVLLILQTFGVQAKIMDKRQKLGEPSLEWAAEPLYDYQNKVVQTAMDAGRGMIRAATGSGKSRMISKIVSNYNLPTVIYVVSLDLLSQMQETLEHCLGVEVGVIGGGSCKIRKINVCSIWSAAKAYAEKAEKGDPAEEDVLIDKWSPSAEQAKSIKEMVESAQLVILDESQFAAAKSVQVVMRNSRAASHRYGCSGTPWRSDGADILLTAAFGPVICNVSASDLIDQGYLVRPKIAFRDIPDQMDMKKEWPFVKRRYIIENDDRNKIIIDNTVKLLEKGRKPLILFREIAHGNMLEEMLPSDIKYRKVTGQLDTSERDKIRADFKAGKFDLILASTVYDQGVDLPALDALILAGGGKSTAKALQRIGRVIRGHPGKEDALIMETFDQAPHVRNHSLERYRAYKSEARFGIAAGPDMQEYLR